MNWKESAAFAAAGFVIGTLLLSAQSLIAVVATQKALDALYPDGDLTPGWPLFVALLAGAIFGWVPDWGRGARR